MTDRLTSESLLAWGRHTESSPLYSHLVKLTARNASLFGIVRQIENLPEANLFLGAIHFLLLSGVEHELATFYPSLVAQSRSVDEIDRYFADFVEQHDKEILNIANSRYTQTNECRRCTALLPAVMTCPYPSFDLVEIGTSAGLNLAMDRYRYDLGGFSWGPESSVVLDAEMRGDSPRLRSIDIGRRIGIDINVINRHDPEDVLWLEALIWPEHHERRGRLQSALVLTRSMDFELHQGDVLDLLGPLLDNLPSGRPVVVTNSLVLNQLSEAGRDQVSAIVEGARSKRPIYRVSLEYLTWKDKWARLEVGDSVELKQFGQAPPHGDWVDLNHEAIVD